MNWHFQMCFTHIQVSHILPLWQKKKAPKQTHSFKITVCFCLRGFDSYQRGTNRCPKVLLWVSFGWTMKNFLQMAVEPWNPKKCSLCSWGFLLVGCQHLFVSGMYITCFFSTSLKMCHCRSVPSVTCPRKNRWNLQESGNPEPWKASDTKTEGKVFVKHGSELRLCWLARKTNLLALFEFDCVFTLLFLQIFHNTKGETSEVFCCFPPHVYLLHLYLVDSSFCHA